MKTASEIALKTILAIGKQSDCYYSPICKKFFNCDEKIPWCKLEKALEDPPHSLVDALDEFTLTNMFRMLEKRIAIEKHPALFEATNDFVCPYFRNKVTNCLLLICPYNSKTVKRTRCILSIDKEVTVSDIAVAKGIQKDKLIKILLNLRIGEDWDIVFNTMNQLLEQHSFCETCGHFLTICEKNPKACRKRYIAKNKFKSTVLPTKLMTYPLVLVIIGMLKLNKNFSMLFPKNILLLYMKPLEEE